jgi:hypothetical protein
MRYKKKTESSLVNYTMRYLAAQENVGRVRWFSRLQSGSVKVQKHWKGKVHSHWMHLCRKGTPDIMAILRDGECLWLELKTSSGKVRPGQAEFRSLVQTLEGHYHLVLRNLDELDSFMTRRYGKW